MRTYTQQVAGSLLKQNRGMITFAARHISVVSSILVRDLSGRTGLGFDSRIDSASSSIWTQSGFGRLDIVKTSAESNSVWTRPRMHNIMMVLISDSTLNTRSV